MSNTLPKRPIDLRRESAGSMEVGLAEEGDITDIFTVGDLRLLMIKERAVYEIKMADSIDPRRSNDAIPNIQQRVFSDGSDSELIVSILLTSGKLFDAIYLPEVDCAVIRECAISATAELLSMRRISSAVRTEHDKLISDLDGQKLENGFIVPSLEDARQRTKNFLQRADHFCRELFLITREFEKGFHDLDNLLRRLRAEKDNDKGIIQFFENSIPYLKFIRNMRNAMEHPIPQKRIEIFDFELTEAGHIAPPMIQVVHPQTPQRRVNLPQFLESTVTSLKNLYGQWIAHLCVRKANFTGFSVGIMSTPDERRASVRSDYVYGIMTDKGLAPLG